MQITGFTTMKKIHYTENYLLAPVHPIEVNLIGAGGTGSQVLTSLARINCALIQLGHPGLHVTVIDDDIVTPSNLGRQLFAPTEIGLNKAFVLTTRINRFFGLDWDAVREQYPYESCATANITITCVDNVKARIEIGKYLRKNKNGSAGDKDYTMPYYWLDFGNTTDTGQVVLGTINPVKQPKKRKIESSVTLKCVDELFNLSEVKDEDSGPSCSLAEALRKQDLFINSTIAQLGCNILWKLFSGSIENHGVFLNLKNQRTNPITIQ